MISRIYIYVVSLVLRLLVARSVRLGRYVTYTHGGREYMRRYAVCGWLTGDPKRESMPHGWRRLLVRLRSHLPNLYVHQILAPDLDPAVHDHPWPWALSLVALGAYREERAVFLGCEKTLCSSGFIDPVTRTITRRAPTFNFLRGTYFHRIDDLSAVRCLDKRGWPACSAHENGTPVYGHKHGVFTIFLAGPRARAKQWGYLVAGRGYVPHQERHIEIEGKEIRGEAPLAHAAGKSLDTLGVYSPADGFCLGASPDAPKRFFEAEQKRAEALLPPGRTLAAEYLRLRAACEKQSAQLVRAIELRVAADQRAGRKNVARLEQVIEEQAEVITLLQDVVEQAPWKSCAHQQRALQRALIENEEGEASEGARGRIQELFDVALDQERTTEEIESLKAKGLLPR